MGTDELCNPVDENLLGCCAECEWVIVPKDNVSSWCYHRITGTDICLTHQHHTLGPCVSILQKVAFMNGLPVLINPIL